MRPRLDARENLQITNIFSNLSRLYFLRTHHDSWLERDCNPGYTCSECDGTGGRIKFQVTTGTNGKQELTDAITINYMDYMASHGMGRDIEEMKSMVKRHQNIDRI